jgi:hypothetical protein
MRYGRGFARRIWQDNGFSGKLNCYFVRPKGHGLVSRSEVARYGCFRHANCLLRPQHDRLARAEDVSAQKLVTLWITCFTF